jgi:hypothetical protein
MRVITVGFPRWHASLLGYESDHAAVLSHLLVIGEWHRPNLSGSVARSAIGVNDGGNIGSEGNWLCKSTNKSEGKNEKEQVFHAIRI